MKISELIEQLGEVQGRVGDVEVRMCFYERILANIERVTVVPDTFGAPFVYIENRPLSAAIC